MPDKFQDPQLFGHSVRVLTQAGAAGALRAAAASRAAAAAAFRAVEALRALGSFRASFRAVFCQHLEQFLLACRADLRRVSGAKREVACHSQD